MFTFKQIHNTMVDDLIRELARPDSNKTELLVQIADNVSSQGIEVQHVVFFTDLLFDIETSVKLSVSNKLYVIRQILIPEQNAKLPLDLISRIISYVGVPEILYVGNKKSKSDKFLHQSLQVPMLVWLISFLHLFGAGVYKLLQLYLPVLFNLLSFEYSRAPIANLIFLTTMTLKSVKRWCVQLVVDLHHKFPIDDSLKCLLLLFKSLGTVINESVDLEATNVNVFKYPEQYIRSSKNRLLNQHLRYYSSFQIRNRKRLKQIHNSSSEELNVIEFANSKDVPLGNINSINDLVKNFFGIHSVNIDQLLDSNDPLEQYYFVLRCISDEVTLAKLDYYIRLCFLDDNLTPAKFDTLVTNLVQIFILSGRSVSFKSVDSFILSRLTPVIQDPGQRRKLALLRILSQDESQNLNQQFLTPLLDTLIVEETSIYQLVDQLVVYWLVRPNYSEISKSIISLCTFAVKNPKLDCHYMLIRLFAYIRSMKLDDINNYFPDEAVVPDPFLVYKLLLSNDPFVVSELCGYIAFIKNYKFKTSHFKSLQNTYIMDLVNYIWRDKSFYFDGSINKAFMLHPTFLSNLDKLNAFNYSNVASLNSVGNLFINPTWCFIASQSIWRFEDIDEDISVRHEGPVSKDSVEKLGHTGKWLEWSYDELKVHLLNEFDTLGFHGLAELLFNSLRTLQDKRTRVADQS